MVVYQTIIFILQFLFFNSPLDYQIFYLHQSIGFLPFSPIGLKSFLPSYKQL